ncbi:hypothetical protein [Neorhizobium alkalisoli]|uniref:Uncharacterized protein n=1 Tax=Neorhizobium alkalisoli TaxID=528178 RepID=A0A561R7A6_9HYPH|nr:hypothetical protein [Neorhizobium alkalisoli]TWF58485.1 hypothetical protein FHW37_101289 [Neorhizobium alkalisoli]
MAKNFVFCAIFLMLAAIASTADAQSSRNDFSVRMLQAERACLSGSSHEQTLKVDLKAVADKVNGILNSTIDAASKDVQLRGQFDIMDAAVRRGANADTIDCYEKANIFCLLRGECGPIIALLDGDGIKYERDMDGLSNRRRIRDILANRFANPKPQYRELGIWSGWDKSQEVTELSPDVVLIHWSAFEREENIPSSRDRNCFPIKFSDISKSNICSSKIFDLMSLIEKNNPRPVSFVIYSRMPWMCTDEFKENMFRYLPRDNREIGKRVFMFTVPDNGKGFANEGIGFDLEQIVNYALGRPTAYRQSESPGRCLLRAD